MADNLDPMNAGGSRPKGRRLSLRSFVIGAGLGVGSGLAVAAFLIEGDLRMVNRPLARVSPSAGAALEPAATDCRQGANVQFGPPDACGSTDDGMLPVVRTDLAVDFGVPAVAESEPPSTGYLKGVVVDSAGHCVSGVRVTAFASDPSRCPAATYAEQCHLDVVPDGGGRDRTGADGRFAVFGLDPASRYDVFADLQGTDLWWVESCAMPALEAIAPTGEQRVVLPFGIVTVRVAMPLELAGADDSIVGLDVRLRVTRGQGDETILSDAGRRETTRIAVPFDQPIDVALSGTGIREQIRTGISVSRAAGTADVVLAVDCTGLAHRLVIGVTDGTESPVPDVWLYEIASFDPPRLETLRATSCSEREQGYFVFDLLEARTHAFVAMPDADSDFAPAGAWIDLPVASARELMIALPRGEYAEVRVATGAVEASLRELRAPHLEFDLGRIVEWVEVGHSSWERVRTFQPGRTYRSTFRLPLGRYELRYEIGGEERVDRFEVEIGHRARIEVTARR